MFADDTNRAVINLKLPKNSAFLSARKYEAHPQSAFPWGHVQKQNTIA
jgi:hypothetical protein